MQTSHRITVTELNIDGNGIPPCHWTQVVLNDVELSAVENITKLTGEQSPSAPDEVLNEAKVNIQWNVDKPFDGFLTIEPE